MEFLGAPSTTLVDKLKNVLFVFVIYALYLFTYMGIMDTIGYQAAWVWPLILSPVIEELVFRVGPIGLVKDSPKLILPTIILSSALFGYLHQGAISWPVQGVFGFLLSVVYIKNNRSYWSIVLLHAMWNTYVTFILEKL